MNRYGQIIDKLKENKFVVYGAGGHGKKFVQAITNIGLSKNFMGYAVTDNKNNQDIKTIYEVDKEQLIIIAAHNVNSKQMETILKENGFQNYEIIYPYLIELCCGIPIKKNVMLNIKEFVANCYSANYLAIIYLAIDCVLGNNKFGKDLYIKMFEVTSDKQTAYKRWEALKARIINYKNSKEIEKYNVKINFRQKYILDGAHRIMMAFYFGVDNLLADDYEMDRKEYNAIFQQDLFYDENILNIFSSQECEILKNVKEKVMRQA